MIYLSNFIIYNIILYAVVISILGYGILTSRLIKFYPLFYFSISHYFIMGLLFIGSISIIFNIFFPISDYYSILIILLGLIIFINQYKIIFKNIKKIFHYLVFIVLLALIISFYAGLSDDYDYHWISILNYKTKYLYQIEHERRISYNSYWLFLNSIFYITFIKSSLYSLSALLYAVIQFDLIKILKKKIEFNFFISLFAFFCIVFLFGVINIYKDFGTDIAGVLISIFIFLNIFLIVSKQSKDNKNSISYIFLLITFVIMIKITNALIFFYFLTFLFLINFKFKDFIYSKILIIFLPLLLWVYQNLNISGCIIWPISSLCLINKELTYEELFLIESFAKGDRQVMMNVDGFQWISKWLSTHFHKFIETYFLYIFFLIMPLLIFKFKNRNIYFISTLLKNLKNIEFQYSYYFILPVILANITWFFLYPAYRFGIFYNLTLIFFLLFPFWFVIKENKVFFNKVSVILISISLLFFFYANVSRMSWYQEKYNSTWPPIYKSNIVLKYD